jgi:carboxyl-terminal processing protease
MKQKNTLWKVLWILINAILAALGGGTLAFGTLKLAPPLVLLFGIGFALLIGGLWAWALRYPMRTRALGVLTLAFVLTLGLLSLVQLRAAGQILVNTNNRAENFRQLCQVVQAHYPYFYEKNINWEEICQRYQSLAQAAQTDAEYHSLVANLLAELGDAHTGLIHPHPGQGRLYFGTGLRLDDGIVIDQLGETARTAGVLPGAQILSVNGLPTEQALKALPAALKTGANDRQSRERAAFHILSTTEDTIELTYQNSNGPVETIILRRPENLPVPANTQNAHPGPLITAETLPDGWGLIRIPTFSAGDNHDLVAEFDQAIERVHNAPGLILDLRGNGGGDSRLADRMAGRFFAQPFCYGQDHFRQRIPIRAWSLGFDYCVQPRDETVTAPLVLLMDGRNMSSAEQFIAAFSESGRAVTIGRSSGGSSGNPLTFPLPGDGRARFSTGAFRTSSGLLVEGNGLQPDIPVTYTIADFQQSRDPDMLAAQAELARLASAPNWNQIEAYMNEQIHLHRMPGLAVAIADSEQILYAQGFGFSQPAKAVTPQTPFYIASLSKSFTAMAVLQLVESGQVTLDAPVQRYLPWFRVADENLSAQITVRHLLHQTSGMSYQGYRLPALPQKTSMEDNARMLASARLTNAPGTQYQYFNHNYVLLGLIVEAVSGQTFGEFLTQNIFQPLEMAQTYTELRPAQAAGLAQGHNAFLGFAIPGEQAFLPYDLPAGFIISTAEDMGRYLSAHLAAERSGMLSDSGFVSLYTPPAAVNSPYAMGWIAEERNGLDIIYHTGGLDTFSSVMWLLPEQDYAIILLTNQNSLLQLTYSNNAIMQGLVDLLLGNRPAPPAPLWIFHAVLASLYVLTLGFWLIRFRALQNWQPAPDGRKIANAPVSAWLQMLISALFLIGLPAWSLAAQGWIGTRVLFLHYTPDISLWLVLTAGLPLVEAIFKVTKSARETR